jgi:nucleoside-diphosphate-sugar epimerase
MIEHMHPEPRLPARVVILGASGFIGRHLMAHLRAQGVEVLGLSSKDIDLSGSGSGESLARMLRPNDAVVFASCVTPDRGKDMGTAMRNLTIGEQVCTALAKSPCAHLVYISSDAVYADTEALVREDSRCEPSSLYGLAHLTRERMMRLTAEACGMPWLIVRPTLVYGADDTHNSYGPNRFARQANETGIIKIFGNGEEKRDHVYVGDVVGLLGLCLGHQSRGILNVATGRSLSFFDVARLCVASSVRPVRLEHLPRSSAIWHRHFDVTALIRAFPRFAFTPLEAGVAKDYFGERSTAA